jgi:hypothetical protein
MLTNCVPSEIDQFSCETPKIVEKIAYAAERLCMKLGY